MNDNIFLKIIRKEVPTTFIYEDDEVLAFPDIHPIAPVHILIIPKKPIVSIASMEPVDVSIVGKMFLVAKKIAEDLNISEKGYKLLIRVGRDGGQEVPHLHLHLLGGARLAENIHAVDSVMV
ncbi:MAG: histidine triad nucleotide-binding protein [Candidatus Moranbacteria bacterium]|nr:histidine triad nucleotide-binding protein [Candidatus Moranbacteria bacterium]MDD3964750.1 histidine triad nucleotide-binding protein [Candidatus Moranbacteria bacterium]